MQERLRERRPRLQTLLMLMGIVLIVLILGRLDFVDLPDWLDGGESDPAPRGAVIYEGQTARSVSEDFLIDIGNGEATVSVKAKQDHDKAGNIFSGDFQSTNGTSSVSDPADGDSPARLTVKVDYCADGSITTTERLVENDEGDPTIDRSLRFELGRLFVCDATLEHTVENDSAFKQDDTPADFHGKFVSFVAGAVETTAAASACPTEELERFGEPELIEFMERRLADQHGVPLRNVEVVPGKPGQSSRETQRELRSELESFANMQDPDNPDREFEALDIQYLSGDNEAVEDSCYKDPGSVELDTLENVDAPDPTPDV